MPCVGVQPGIAVVQPVDVRQQDQQVGADRLCDPGGQPVVVAEADFLGCYRIVFVDQRDGAEAEEGAQRLARV